MLTASKQITYLSLAAIGLAATWYFNVQFMLTAADSSAIGFIKGGFANMASSSLSVDIGVVFIVFCLFTYHEGKKLAMKNWWIFPLLGLFIAAAFAFPLFLFFRERAQAKAAG